MSSLRITIAAAGIMILLAGAVDAAPRPDSVRSLVLADGQQVDVALFSDRVKRRGPGLAAAFREHVITRLAAAGRDARLGRVHAPPAVRLRGTVTRSTRVVGADGTTFHVAVSLVVSAKTGSALVSASRGEATLRVEGRIGRTEERGFRLEALAAATDEALSGILKSKATTMAHGRAVSKVALRSASR